MSTTKPENRICPYAMVYMVWWPEHQIVKFGRCWKMTRIREFLASGAHLIYLSEPMERDAERHVLQRARQSFERAFKTAKEAESLFWRGRGYTECFVIPNESLEWAIEHVYIGGIHPYVGQEADAIAWRRAREREVRAAAGLGPAPGDIVADALRLAGQGHPEPSEDQRRDLATTIDDEPHPTERTDSPLTDASRGLDATPGRDPVAHDLPITEPESDPLPNPRTLPSSATGSAFKPRSTTDSKTAKFQRSNHSHENGSRGRERERAGESERGSEGPRPFPPESNTLDPASTFQILQTSHGRPPRWCRLPRLRHRQRTINPPHRTPRRSPRCGTAGRAFAQRSVANDRRRAERARDFSRNCIRREAGRSDARAGPSLRAGPI